MKFIWNIFSPLMLASVATAQNNPGWPNSPPETLEEAVARLGAAPVVEAEAPPDVQASALPSSQLMELQQLGGTGSSSALVGPAPRIADNFADGITPEIANLARGLRYDPTRIFAFVRNHIDFVPYYGCKKGAHLALMEMSGNDMDQSALLVALLRASGYSPSYRSGPVAFFPNLHVLWNGISTRPFPYLSDEQFTAAIGMSPTDPQLVNERIFYGLTAYLRGSAIRSWSGSMYPACGPSGFRTFGWWWWWTAPPISFRLPTSSLSDLESAGCSDPPLLNTSM